jgi:hypothetical protein
VAVSKLSISSVVGEHVQAQAAEVLPWSGYAMPPLQISAVQTLESAAIGVLSGCVTSAGQLPEVPVQVSWMSQTPTAARHTAPLLAKPSAGHAPAPSQLSATSHPPPPAARHTVVFGSLLTRHVPDPLHVSGLSQAVSLELPQLRPLVRLPQVPFAAAPAAVEQA